MGSAVARRRGPGRAALAFWILALCAPAPPAAGGVQAVRGSGESLIDESSPDETPSAPARPGSSASLAERLREYVEGSLARYDALKSESAGFRRQGWFPSLFLRDPERDVVLEPGPAGTTGVTVDVSCARRDLEQHLVIAPAERFELPGADRRFFAEVLCALATAAPEVGHARLRFWFAVLRADGRMTWESRGGIGLGSAAARRLPAGSRTAEAVWPLLDENTLPPALWDGP
jgi:hypothetical protein